MPRLKILGDDLDAYRLSAVMAFPEDEARRRQWFAHHKVLREANRTDLGAAVALTVGELRDSLEAPQTAEFRRMAEAVARDGIAVGGVLATLYVMDRFNLPEPSFRKARFVYSSYAAETMFTDGEPMSVSERTLKTIWSRYETVAHLWAAKFLNIDYIITRDDPRSPSGMKAMMEASAGILEWGQRFVPLRAKPAVAILDEKRAWKLPSNIAPRHLMAERQPDKLLDFLKKYKAPEYKL